MANPSLLHLSFLISFLYFHHVHSQPENIFNLYNFDAQSTTSYCRSSSIAINLPPPYPNSSLTLVCYEHTITQLHITGNNQLGFHHQNFSTESFFSTISATIPSLKVLSLVSLGLHGPLPGSVLANGLSSLEILNISSNQIYGGIPFEISYLKNLQSLVFDHNNFTGRVPVWLGLSLPLLTVLSFKNNSLDGFLPSSLARMVSLRVLDLSMNRLSGEVPPDFKNLTNLQVLDLRRNQFGPRFPVLHNRLITLVLSENRFGLGIPTDDLRSFYQLRKLDLSANEFRGSFPPLLFSLPSLAYLDVSRNKFTGRLSENVSCGEELGFLDLSSNRFTGNVPICMQRLEKKRKHSVFYGDNCLLDDVGQDAQRNVSFCRTEALAVNIITRTDDSPGKPRVKAVVVSGVVGGVVFGGFAVFGVMVVAVRRKHLGSGCDAAPQIRLILEKVSPAYTLKMLADARYISETMKLGAAGIPPYRSYVLGELMEATDNFHTSNLMGSGSLGQLYKGQLGDGTMIAIRSLKMKKRCSIQSYTHQIGLISKVRHPNLVNPIGHCFDCNPRDSPIVRGVFLVFEFVPNGSLRASISVGQKFSWEQRLAAAIGIAKGLQFLHTAVVPRTSNNLKITDVLLDHSFHVKIAAYNHTSVSENKRSVTRSKGALPRRPNNEDDEHDDVYDLGVILLELILGRAIDSVNDITLAKDLLQVSVATDDMGRRSIVDPSIHKECFDESLKTLMELCVKCVSKDRPSIDDVLWNLEFIAQAQNSSNQVSPDATFVCITE